MEILEDLENTIPVEEFTVDRFEEDVAVLENRQTGEMIDVNKNELPENIKEGDILKKVNDEYILDEELTNEISKALDEKLKNFWD